MPTLNATLVQDCQVDSDFASTNKNNGKLHIYTYPTAVNWAGSLLQWDLSPIPAGSTINAATLSLYASNIGAAAPTDCRAFVVTDVWNAATVTFNTRPATTTAGKSDRFTLFTTTGLKTMDMQVTIQYLLDNQPSNASFILKGDPENGVSYGDVDFVDSEHAGANPGPALSIDYTPPGQPSSKRIRTIPHMGRLAVVQGRF